MHSKITKEKNNRPFWLKPLSEFGIRKYDTRFRLEDHSPSIPNGTIISNYQIIEMIGVGGFGEVYRAKNIQVEREVAIKIYKVLNENAFEFFRGGANLLSQLNHSNIIIMYDFFTFDKYALMVMELLNPHTTLRKRVGDFTSPYKIHELINIFKDILRAIKYCHLTKYRDIDGKIKTGIYHGDIKPDNIFDLNGIIKITDFMIPNLEKLLDRVFKLGYGRVYFPTPPTELFGTPMYMSPEQQNDVVNEQTDIYSIGITIFELLTGFYPYDSKKDFYDNEPLPIERFNKYSPLWLNNIIMKCIANDPKKRYSHISEIEKEITLIEFQQNKFENSYISYLSKDKEVTISILFLSADPSDTTKLRLGEEFREIQEKLQLSKYRRHFILNQRASIRPQDLTQALIDLKPNIVHFSGHGRCAGEICIEDNFGNTHLLEPDTLAALFEQFSNQIDCVILNACYSEIQANMIAKHIKYVIGMNQEIGDRAAIAFSIGFYQALGGGRSIEEAHKLGVVQIRLQDIPEHLIPVLIKKSVLF